MSFVSFCKRVGIHSITLTGRGWGEKEEVEEDGGREEVEHTDILTGALTNILTNARCFVSTPIIAFELSSKCAMH